MTQTQRQLSAVPAAQRRRAAGALVLLAVLLAVAGVLPWVRPAPPSVRVIAVAALLAALLAALVAWGLASSVRLDTRRADEARLDAMLAASAGSCDCGHDHGGDPHPAAEAQPCASADDSCQHDCAACVLSRRG